MLVRPIAPTDEEAYRTILESTTAEDRYCRFFHLVDHFDSEEVHRFVEDRADTIGVIAFEGTVPLGAAHAVLLDEESAELAIVVARGTRHAGVGTAMLDALIERVRARGLRRLVACALRENTPFVHLARHAGFRVDEAEGSTQHWVLPLDVDHEATAS
ncbi:MAG: GNAT family N-acetyltransferase [Candidatus Eremiobacteraeota bacterium]|nr:GNAT family N-acetyltransferase [Candidatus Eremiobacteraeota bacterium]